MSRAGVLALALAAPIAGCGVGAGEDAGGGTSVTVTRDFGARPVGAASAKRVPGGETAMRFLQRHFEVGTRYGGAFVQSIDGLSGGREDGRAVDWFYYVNGIEADRGAAATRLHPGDRVWWDRHAWDAAMAVPAVVGSFPEPFRSGVGGKRLPVQVACTDDAGPACDEVGRRLHEAGAKVGSAALGSGAGGQTLRVVVGPWASARADPIVRRIERGPGLTGVFARFASDGRRLTVLDDRGRPATTLAAAAGLVAATRLREQQPTWVVSGTDGAGVLAAARALREARLRHRFALVLDRGRALRVPAR